MHFAKIGALPPTDNEGLRGAVGSKWRLCYRRAIAPCLLRLSEVRLMSVDADTVRRVANLARIAVAEDEVESLKGELNAMLAFVEQLVEANVDGVEPMTSVTPVAMKMREDKVTDGGIADDIIANAPAHEHHFFLVPKVVE
jgi:aspartyl-tRNA(Asn)/glutamyl-tRNA(Gln) amidotransferase subunit C